MIAPRGGILILAHLLIVISVGLWRAAKALYQKARLSLRLSKII
jgi:hypothetical protein